MNNGANTIVLEKYGSCRCYNPNSSFVRRNDNEDTFSDDDAYVSYDIEIF